VIFIRKSIAESRCP